MLDLCIRLKAYLERTFSMPFEVYPSKEDGEIIYRCNPSNDGDLYFNVIAYIHNHIRLIVNITPQKHGGYILNDMALANTEKRATFLQYIEMLKSIGSKIEFSVNGISLISNNIWPTNWRNFHCKITKIPILEYEDEQSEFSILAEWIQHGVNLIFSLLTISDVVDKDETLEIQQGEGIAYEIKSKRYERNSINRQLCLYTKGYTCSACGMNFYDMYGVVGKEFIEVHHTTPVSQMGAGYILDIKRDLVPLCSNCHSIAHRRNPPYSVAELKHFVEQYNYNVGSLVAESPIEYQSTNLNLVVGVVKTNRIEMFKNETSKLYYFGKRFPSKYNLKQIQYFAPYYEGGIRGYYDVLSVRTAKKKEIVPEEESDDNDIRIVLDLGDYHNLFDAPYKVKLANYNHACLCLSDLISQQRTL